MHTIYKINGTNYLDPEKEYSDPDIYPLFQENYTKFKKILADESKLKINNTYYKFGDGDYLLFKDKKHGTTKPGVRDIKRSIKALDIDKVKISALKHDKYFCEIINSHMMDEVLKKPLDFPAEYLYASVANKWFFNNFKKISIIGSEVKLELIHELMKNKEYKNYIGALSNSKKIFSSIKNYVKSSNPDVFLAGIGLAQNTLLKQLKEVSNVPIISIGSGVDAIAGVIDIYRPYYGGWTNYRIKNSKLYKKIKDPVLYTTSSGKNVKEI